LSLSQLFGLYLAKKFIRLDFFLPHCK